MVAVRPLASVEAVRCGVSGQRFVSYYAGPGKFPGPNLLCRGGGGWLPGLILFSHSRTQADPSIFCPVVASCAGAVAAPGPGRSILP